MLRVQKLSDVGVLLVETIRRTVGATVEVRLASPVEDPDSPDASVRVSFLWIAPSATHRGERLENLPDGRMPISSTLHAFYLISTCGMNEAGDCVLGHDLLGQIITQLNAEPTIGIPDDGETGGGLNVLLSPSDVDLLKRIYMVMQVRPRPWLVVDVGPIQLLGSPQEP